MPLVSPRMRSERVQAVLIALLVVLLAVFTWFLPPRAEVLHNILHHLNILPFMLAGMVFGWKGALRTILLAVLLQAPSIYRHWQRVPLDAEDQIVELSTFGTAGLIAGLLADRERMQRRRVEATKLELEKVYVELGLSIEQMKKTERLTAAGQLSASLAHEIRNPLASISGVAGILARGQAPPERQAECLEILSTESQRLNRLLTNFLEFASPRLPRFQPTEPAAILQAVTSLAQHPAEGRQIALALAIDPRPQEIDCDPEQIKQLLLNLILNAIEASPAGSRVEIDCFPAGDALCIEIRDQGRGVRPEDRERIFEPFFTTRENGTGLGLAIAANIAAQHGGRLVCLAGERAGTAFRLLLPTGGRRVVA